MPTRANWHIDELSLDDDLDPFSAPIEELGERIDLRDPGAVLQLRVTELLHRESNLFNAGVTCPIKDRPDSTCHACPVSRAGDHSERLSALCKLGREQETVLTELAVLTCQGR